MLQISLRTLRRRMSEYGITQKMLQSTITELELDDKIREIVRYFLQIGYTSLLGELERQSIRITRSKARESLQQIDPVGVTERWLQGPVSRRKYSVFFKLFLWLYLVPLPNISTFTSFFSYILDTLMSCRVGQNSNSLLTT